ncbi:MULTISPECIES: flagellar hook-length control protein FliK [unclassified Burkholderia]|uniref:flagellar hook-length control protein FliK n=1 Tax=unclassified Burkholderia TaxID=2613784 RepID=UPI000F5651FF|nr:MULTISPECIES: flagellar hook-length control protein FliK [unclassified Burkholderia]RQR30428.1 flagellar hook-length control protein FliK [Burkholderia sp. Bp9142]RQR48473.1 flagellar hook-length control protein FliK [Burkholderia sp. Bp9140]
MTGIDSVAAALLASRLDSLLTGTVPASAGGGATAQVGTPGAGASAPSSAGAPPAAPPASAQTALSDVALVLDAISRTGGVATPVIAGRTPLLADPSVLLSAAAVPPDGRPAAGPAASAAASSAASPAASPASDVAAARAAADAPPVAALRAALAQAVSESGLFYESHLAQWLAGQRPLAALMREPQARLTTAPVQPAPDAAQHDAPDLLDELLAQRLPLPAAAPRPAAQPGAPVPGGAAPHELAPSAQAAARQGTAPGTAGMADPLGGHPDTRWTSARAELAAASADPQAQASAPVHPAAVPIVRQQLDALATDQFRWTGEAWPGARLDWTIEPDDPGGPGSRGGGDAGDGIAWRTRLTLTLPSLGTVDAELVLNGKQLVARLRANSAGADRLTRNEAALRQRFEGSGLQLGGLSIRAVGDEPDGFDPLVAQAAAAAYARSAAGGTPGADDEAPR